MIIHGVDHTFIGMIFLSQALLTAQIQPNRPSPDGASLWKMKGKEEKKCWRVFFGSVVASKGEKRGWCDSKNGDFCVRGRKRVFFFLPFFSTEERRE